MKMDYYIVEAIRTQEVLIEGSKGSCEAYLRNLVQEFGVNENNFTIYKPCDIKYKCEYIEN